MDHHYARRSSGLMITYQEVKCVFKIFGHNFQIWGYERFVSVCFEYSQVIGLFAGSYGFLISLLSFLYKIP